MIKRIHPLVLIALTLLWQNPTASAAKQPNCNTRGKVVHYRDFGARGDGKTDDMAAIAKAHAYANEHGLPVKLGHNATYYIGGGNHPAVIQTDTDFGKARFIIDDTAVKDRNAPIFLVQSTQKPVPLHTITSLKSKQSQVRTGLSRPCLLRVTDHSVKHFIRYGLNQNRGSSKTEVFLVDKDGTVDHRTPIIWDFKRVSKVTAYPVDQKTLKITGGHFTTIANNSKSTGYFARGLSIRRSNVLVDGLQHRVTGEGKHGAPYWGFINIGECAFVKVRNSTLHGHKTYTKIGNAGKPVRMGTYDIAVSHAVNITFENCKQFDDILDRSHWGIMASNFCKNLTLHGCKLSRFDAHQGVFDVTIRNSTLGHAGINAIGWGTLLLEKSTVYGRSLINLRSDYGSTWKGKFIIRDCIFVPSCGRPAAPSLISGRNNGQHDFGYACHMPAHIVIDGLRIDDTHHPAVYKGPTIFADFNSRFSDAGYVEKFPYIKTREVHLCKVTTASGKPLHTSDNPVMFRKVMVVKH